MFLFTIVMNDVREIIKMSVKILGVKTQSNLAFQSGWFFNQQSRFFLVDNYADNSLLVIVPPGCSGLTGLDNGAREADTDPHPSSLHQPGIKLNTQVQIVN